jgi:ribose 5-phosphate isomerase B
METLRQFTTIHLGTDHAGFALKEEVKAWLTSEGFTVVDHGTYEFDSEDDFPDFVVPAAQAVAAADNSVAGIIFGGSGQGEAIAANRITGVRAAVYYGGNRSIAPLSRQHNDANILSIGARFVTSDEAKSVIWEWLHTAALLEEKYARRNLKIEHHAK